MARLEKTLAECERKVKKSCPFIKVYDVLADSEHTNPLLPPPAAGQSQPGDYSYPSLTPIEDRATPSASTADQG